MNKIIKIILFLAFAFSITPIPLLANDKIKIGLLVPLTGKNSEIGQSIIKSTRLAINTINNVSIEIVPKDTQSNPAITLRAAKELANSGIKIVIGPVFNESLIYLDELNELTFLALTNKNDNFSKNIINAGINATSQLNAIKKFIELNEIKKTIFLTPNVSFTNEIEKAISNSKIKILENYIYNTDPTKLTKQIEKITRYDVRKQNLEDEINRLEKSEQNNKERLIEKLKQLEIPLGLYKQDENPIPNHAIACYITANPRCNKKALQLMMKKGLDLMIANDNRFNLHQEAMSCVQKSKSYTFVLDFDIDIDKDLFKELDIENKVLQYVNEEAISWLETRGGFHLLIKPNLVNKEFSKTFYNNIVKNIPYMIINNDRKILSIYNNYCCLLS